MLRHKQYHLHRIMRKHRDMMNNDSFNRHVAAYEYMKRNLYFVQLASAYLEPSATGTYSQGELLKLIQQVFLYSGVDLRQKILDKDYMDPKRKLFNDFLQYDDLNAKVHFVNKRYWYSKLYELEDDDEQHSSYDASLYEFMEDDVCEYESSASDNKKMFPVNLDIFNNHKSEERLLKHLTSSICVQFNPSIPNDYIIESLKKLLSELSKMNWDTESKDSYPKSQNGTIDLPYAQFTTPEILINEAGILDYKYTPKSFVERKASHVALIMYDLVKLFKITDVVEIKSIIEKYFGQTSYEGKFLPYIDVQGSNNDYIETLNSMHLEKKLNEVSVKINHDYLKLIYDQEVIDLHEKLIKDSYLKSKDSEKESIEIKVDKLKKIITEDKLTEYDPFLGIVQLSDLNISDYTAMNDTYLSTKVFEIVLL